MEKSMNNMDDGMRVGHLVSMSGLPQRVLEIMKRQPLNSLERPKIKSGVKVSKSQLP